MLPDATSTLSNYLSLVFLKFPWSNFQFSGFITVMAALTTLLADFISTQYYEGKQEKHAQIYRIDPDDLDSVVVPVGWERGRCE